MDSPKAQTNKKFIPNETYKNNFDTIFGCKHDKEKTRPTQDTEEKPTKAPMLHTITTGREPTK